MDLRNYLNNYLFGWEHVWLTLYYWVDYLFLSKDDEERMQLSCWYFWDQLRHNTNHNIYQPPRFTR